MQDPADFKPSEPHRDVKHPRLGEPAYHQLPPVYQQVSRGPGELSTIHVAGARTYLDELRNRNAQPRDGEQA